MNQLPDRQVLLILRGARKNVEPTKILSRGTRGNRYESVRAAIGPYPKRSQNKQTSRTKAQNETLAQPKSKRTADVQQLEIQLTLDEEQKKNVIDLAVGKKKHKTKHTFQPPSRIWSTIPKKPKRKKRKRVKRITARYKGLTKKTRRPKTKADPSIQRNVAALGLSGY